MKTSLTIQEQLDTVEKALKKLNKLHRDKYNEGLYLCWIFYDLLDIHAPGYFLTFVTPYIELFTRENMMLHSKVTFPEGKALYWMNNYVERKKFLLWMIDEYKSQLTI